MNDSTCRPQTAHGWTVFIHPLLRTQLDVLIAKVALLKHKDPTGYAKHNATKRLAAIRKLMLEVVPQDPSRQEYRQGKTLGGDRKHWFRAKFFQQYRLFFRYHAASRIIVFAWVNDKRAYESSDDAYRVFRAMLASGHPPDSWEQLLEDCHQGQV